jgi:hypothetical protein
MDKLKAFINSQMKVGAEADDTLIIYTIGHGGGGGGLQYLGQRKEIMKILAECAEENQQETFWWQLSCHAAAELPGIDTLNPVQQDIFAMTASSPASQVSYFCTQGVIMQKFFNAMAEDSPDVDPDQNGTIVAQEIKDFLNKFVESGRGDLVYAKSPDEPIFGIMSLARLIPIENADGTERDFSKDYIPMPGRGRF